jgi:hypothetical protein
MLQDWAEVMPALFKTILRLYAWSGIGKRQPMFNLSFSNVRGSQEKILGARILANYAFGPAINSIGLNISVSTLNDAVGFGFVASPNLLPDAWSLADNVPLALNNLLEAHRSVESAS